MNAICREFSQLDDVVVGRVPKLEPRRENPQIEERPEGVGHPVSIAVCTADSQRLENWRTSCGLPWSSAEPATQRFDVKGWSVHVDAPEKQGGADECGGGRNGIGAAAG